MVFLFFQCEEKTISNSTNSVINEKSIKRSYKSNFVEAWSILTFNKEFHQHHKQKNLN